MKTSIRATAAAALLTVLAGCASTKASTAPASPAGNGGSASAGAPSDTGSSGSDGSTPSSGPSSSGGASPTAPAPASPPSSVNPGGPISSQVPLPPVRSTAPNGDRIVYVSPEGISVGGDGRTLSTSVEWGGCAEQPQLVVFTQDAKQVVVEVKTVTHYRVGVMCPNIERTGTVTATLGAPLSGRTVVDGVTGRPIAAS
jgi:hypothetical protein